MSTEEQVRIEQTPTSDEIDLAIRFMQTPRDERNYGEFLTIFSIYDDSDRGDPLRRASYVLGRIFGKMRAGLLLCPSADLSVVLKRFDLYRELVIKEHGL